MSSQHTPHPSPQNQGACPGHPPLPSLLWGEAELHRPFHFLTHTRSMRKFQLFPSLTLWQHMADCTFNINSQPSALPGEKCSIPPTPCTLWEKGANSLNEGNKIQECVTEAKALQRFLKARRASGTGLTVTVSRKKTRTSSSAPGDTATSRHSYVFEQEAWQSHSLTKSVRRIFKFRMQNGVFESPDQLERNYWLDLWILCTLEYWWAPRRMKYTNT